MVCTLCNVKPCEGYLKWYCVDCSRLKRLINLHGDRVYEILNNVLLRTEDKQKGKELVEIKKEVNNKQQKLDENLQDSIKLYDNKNVNSEDVIAELKRKINKI